MLVLSLDKRYFEEEFVKTNGILKACIELTGKKVFRTGDRQQLSDFLKSSRFRV